MRSRLASLALFAAAIAPASRADEGMWTADAFPAEQVKAKHGFAPDAAWLKHVQLSAVKLGNGCSASFVSSRGLLLTNHHCARTCIEQLSTPEADLLEKGFLAKSDAEEKQCPALEADVLQQITDVTERLAAATQGKTGGAFQQALKGEMARIEAECATSAALRCDVVTLFHGGRYQLYRYRRYQDVRLSFAPEFGAANFGGYPDNFNFPRFDLDMTLLRVWDSGAPAKVEDFFRWSPDGSKDGELVFIAGNPGATDRKITVAELGFARDTEVPRALLTSSELRATLMDLARTSPEVARYTGPALDGVENGQKVTIGRQEALANPPFFERKGAAEAELRSRLRREVKDWQPYDAAFDDIARTLESFRTFRTELRLTEGGDGLSGELYQFAKTLVRAAAERPKPNPERLREFRESGLPALEQRVVSRRPIHPPLEIARLRLSLTRLLDVLGPDHPFVKDVLGKNTPDEVANALVKGTKLGDAGARAALWRGGQAAIDASKDPMIALARRVDPLQRQIRKRYEGEVEGPLKRSGELVARAHLLVEGTSGYPDATSTLRISYGTVKGWVKDGKPVGPFSDFAGAFERNTGKKPFALAPSWLKAKARLPLQTPLNLCTTNDAVGGNSGSPMFDQDARIIGVLFDGNLPSLAGDYDYDPETNRSIAVDSRAILAALEQIYGAGRLADELRGK